MNDAPANILNPETVLAEMKKNGVTHVVYLPDSETNWLYLLMKADPAIHLVGVNREGHASSIAAGLWLGGAKPLILIQNTGMLEAGDSIRGWLMSLNVPIVLMVGYRGWTRHGVTTDTVATAVMGYDPRAPKGTAPFVDCDNSLQLAEARGVGTTDLKNIEVRGLAIREALFPFA